MLNNVCWKAAIPVPNSNNLENCQNTSGCLTCETVALKHWLYWRLALTYSTPSFKHSINTFLWPHTCQNTLTRALRFKSFNMTTRIRVWVASNESFLRVKVLYSLLSERLMLYFCSSRLIIVRWRCIEIGTITLKSDLGKLHTCPSMYSLDLSNWTYKCFVENDVIHVLNHFYSPMKITELLKADDTPPFWENELVKLLQ